MDESGKIKWLGAECQFVEGIPARDLSRDEWDALPPHIRQKAIFSGLYANVPEDVMRQNDAPIIVTFQEHEDADEQEVNEANAAS